MVLCYDVDAGDKRAGRVARGEQAVSMYDGRLDSCKLGRDNLEFGRLSMREGAGARGVTR